VSYPARRTLGALKPDSVPAGGGHEEAALLLSMGAVETKAREGVLPEEGVTQHGDARDAGALGVVGCGVDILV
jgi:hypothetical protein